MLRNDYLKLENKEDDLLLQYSKKNSKSYVLFWTLASKSEASYKPIFEDIFKNLDKTKITDTNIGQVFLNNLLLNKHFTNGNTFPKIEISGESVTAKLGSKYTLIDFWFSYCKPCLEEIPIYKKIYNKYKKLGFEYVGISTDRTQNKDNWEKVVSKNDLKWQNFLDENGNSSKKYNVNKFPTTFLLDNEGKILQKDISPEELEMFLEKNL